MNCPPVTGPEKPETTGNYSGTLYEVLGLRFSGFSSLKPEIMFPPEIGNQAEGGYHD